MAENHIDINKLQTALVTAVTSVFSQINEPKPRATCSRDTSFDNDAEDFVTNKPLRKR